MLEFLVLPMDLYNETPNNLLIKPNLWWIVCNYYEYNNNVDWRDDCHNKQFSMMSQLFITVFVSFFVSFHLYH